MRRHALSLAALLAAAMAVAAAPARAQTVRFGIVAEEVRAQLDSSWNEDPRQVERAYCVRRARVVAQPLGTRGVDSIYRVLAVRSADVREAGPSYAVFECPAGTPELHTHTPATCANDDPQWCVAGGPDAYSCQPSRGDYEKLVRRGDQFAVIQCDRRVFRFYFPHEFAPHATAAGGEPRPGATARPDTGRPDR